MKNQGLQDLRENQDLREKLNEIYLYSLGELHSKHELLGIVEGSDYSKKELIEYVKEYITYWKTQESNYQGKLRNYFQGKLVSLQVISELLKDNLI